METKTIYDGTVWNIVHDKNWAVSDNLDGSMMYLFLFLLNNTNDIFFG